MEEFNKILMLTSVCCMACDGEIATEEVLTLKKLSKEQELYGNRDINADLNAIMDALSKYGFDFVKSYLDLIEKTTFSEQESIRILDVAARTIKADERIEYGEIKFFKAIRRRLNVTDDQIISKIDGVEDYWLEADIQDISFGELETNFNNIDYNISKLNLD